MWKVPTLAVPWCRNPARFLRRSPNLLRDRKSAEYRLRERQVAWLQKNLISTDGLALDGDDESLNKISEVYHREFARRRQVLDAALRPDGIELAGKTPDSPLVRVDIDDPAAVLAEYLRLNPTVAKGRSNTPVSVEYQARPPVVSVMGHVDHGKTTLLDALRNASVAAGEVGGITQSVGAFEVEIGGRRATFIDTPGHQAFSTMRSAAAQATDLIVCVVAATDGVQPQTIEVLQLAQQRKCPVVLAVTKTDLADADMDRISDQIEEYGLVVEDRGGDVIVVPVVAPKGQGLDDLVAAVNLAAELCDPPPTAPSPSRAEGILLESDATDSTLSIIALRGSFEEGMAVVCGQTAFTIQKVTNVEGASVARSTPSQPIVLRVNHASRAAAGQVTSLPSGGSPIVQVATVSEARAAADALVRANITTAGVASAASVALRQFEKRVWELGRHSVPDTVTVNDTTGTLQGVDEGDLEASGEASFSVGMKMVQRVFVNVVVVADTQGSLAAVVSELSKIPSCEVVLRVLHADTVGSTVPTRLLRMAKGAGAAVLAFKTTPSVAADNNPTPPPGFERFPSSRALALCVPVDQPTPGAFDRVYRCAWWEDKNPSRPHATYEGHVPLFTFEVVYDLVATAVSLMESSLPPAVRIGQTGEANVLAVFPKSFSAAEREKIRAGKLQPFSVAGCSCVSGKLTRTGAARIEVWRTGKLLLTASQLESLRHFKAEVSEIPAGKECGVGISGYQPQVNDVIKMFGVKRSPRSLEESVTAVVDEAE